MKLILSRKGFDSTYGGCASPIFEDGSMVSLPIPLEGAPHRLADATRHNVNFADRDVLADLTRGRLDKSFAVHLDPYLRPYDSNAGSAWRQAFGQDGGAQGHLKKQGVEQGDLFLFFGWFRREQQTSRRPLAVRAETARPSRPVRLVAGR